MELGKIWISNLWDHTNLLKEDNGKVVHTIFTRENMGVVMWRPQTTRLYGIAQQEGYYAYVIHGDVDSVRALSPFDTLEAAKDHVEDLILKRENG